MMHPVVVICGSYHRDPDGLRRLFHELEATGCRILSPLKIDFVNNSDKVVRLKSEEEFSIYELEKYHLRAIREADLVWLHSPRGHIGISGAFEIGFATAVGKKIFCRVMPEDEMLASQVLQVESVYESLEAISLSAF